VAGAFAFVVGSARARTLLRGVLIVDITPQEMGMDASLFSRPGGER
jgi:hypothetical protein